MKTRFLSLFLVVIALGCSKQNPSDEKTNLLDETDNFYASLSSTDTKVYWYKDGSSLKLSWNKNDAISIFKESTLNQKYLFNGDDARTGTFSKCKSDDFYIADDLLTNYAIYPYSKENSINEYGTMYTRIPGKQTGSSILMAAVTKTAEDRHLSFKNLCGYLLIEITGIDAANVQSLCLQGNDNETISGYCNVRWTKDEDPELEMVDQWKATNTDRIFVPNEREDNLYLFQIPPTTFGKGFTMTAVSKDGRTFIKEVTGVKKIERNTLNKMTPVDVIFEGEGGFIEFDDLQFKSYIISRYDMDGDNEISVIEAESITSIECPKMSIKSLKGIERFSSLRHLVCYGNELETLDLSNNTLLDYLDCNNNKLTSLDLSNNTILTGVFCYNNLLESLVIDSNPDLRVLGCGQNLLESIDVSNCTKLTELSCNNNNLTSLNISSNTSLRHLEYSSNPMLSPVDISMLDNLEILIMDYISGVSEPVFPHPEKIKTFYASGTGLSKWDYTDMPNLEEFAANNAPLGQLPVFYSDTNIKSLHLSGDVSAQFINDPCFFSRYPNLAYLNCCCTKATTLDFSNNPKIESAWITDAENLTTIDLSASPDLEFLSINNDPNLKTIYVHENVDIDKLTIESEGSHPTIERKQ